MAMEEVYIDSDQFFSNLLQTIASAQQSVYIETYIFDQDKLGFAVLDALAAAAAKGLKVQLLLDGVGSSHWTFSEAETYRQKGIDLQFFHPLAWQKHPTKILLSLTLQKIIMGFSKMNHRNHRKIAIIDQKILFICSMNISDRHLKSINGDKAWRDTGVRLEGDAIQPHLLSTHETWTYPQQFLGRRWLQIRKQKKKLHSEILKILITATGHIWITNPYFVPDFKLVRALFKAARAGVDIKVLVPMQSDILGIKFAMQGFYSALLKRGCQIYEYTPSILHAKVLIVDNWASIGSTNLDYRSIFYNLEADIVLQNPENVMLVKEQFLNDLRNSKQIHLSEWKKRPWYHRVLQRFFLIFRGVF